MGEQTEPYDLAQFPGAARGNDRHHVPYRFRTDRPRGTAAADDVPPRTPDHPPAVRRGPATGRRPRGGGLTVRVPGFWYAVLVLLVVASGAVAVRYARRLVTVTRVLRRGVRTGGECVRVETEPYQRPEGVRHFFAFHTTDGTRVEFEDLVRRSTEEGTPVAVTYDPRDPAGTAAVAGRGDWPPVLRTLALTSGFGLAAAGFTAVLVRGVLGGG